MPAFGYMLLLNENVHAYLTIKYDGWLLSYLPNIWRIWLLFYGSFLLALATILYSLFCPQQVKRYGSPYEQAEAEALHLYRLGGIAGFLEELGRLYKGMSKRENALFTIKPLDLRYPGDVEGQKNKLSNALIHSYLVQNLKKPLLRVLVLALFSIGLFLIAIPAVITFLQVTWLAVKHVAG